MRFKLESLRHWISFLLAVVFVQTTGINGDDNRWPALTLSVAITGERCITPCIKHRKPLPTLFSSSGYSCDVYKELPLPPNFGEKRRPCSPVAGLDTHGTRCYDDCKPYENYQYCYLDNKQSKWGYCSTPDKPASTPLLTQHMTIYGKPCISSCTQEGKSYSWCYITDGHGEWDYCSSKPGFGIKGKECHERKCDYNGESYTWCWLHENQKDWSYCGQAHLFSVQAKTYLGTKCLTPCLLDGVGTINSCLDATGGKRECSRLLYLATNNMKCHSKCDYTGGSDDDDFKEGYNWCYTSADKSSSWNKCSEVQDYPLLVNGSEPGWLAKVEHFPITENNAELFFSGAKENVLGMHDDQGRSEFTFFERLENIGEKGTQQLIDNDEKLQRVAVVCLAYWKEKQFHVKPSHKFGSVKLAFADEKGGEIGVKLEQKEPHKLNGKEYLDLQLVYCGYKKLETGARSKVAEVVVPVEVAQKTPELVVDALLRSMYGGFKVHIGRFSYNPKERRNAGKGSTNIL